MKKKKGYLGWKELDSWYP